MFAPALPFVALLVASAGGRPGALGPKNVSQKDAEFERTYADEVNGELVNIYTFNHTVTRNRVRSPGELRGRGAGGGGAGPGAGPGGRAGAGVPLPEPRCAPRSSRPAAAEVVASPSSC